MPVYYDQLHREIVLQSPPKRIISVVPSQTELLYYLGLDKKIVGISKFCIYPAKKFKAKTKVGGTKTLNISKIKKLEPDLIIANKEENERSQVEELMNHFPVWISDIDTVAGAIDMIAKVGQVTGKVQEGEVLSQKITERFSSLEIVPSGLRAAYFIWRKPYMVAGKGTFIDSMLQKCGLTNAFQVERYPEIDTATLFEANPDVVLLSSEPYPFKDRHIAEIRAILPEAKIKIVDGEIFSWYGNRLLHAPEYFKKLAEELHFAS